MRYLIKTQEDDRLEDLVADEELTMIHRYKHVPYVSIETEIEYEQLTTRYPDYQITKDKDYDTQNPARDPQERRYDDQ